ncbi:hypothetical protein BJV85_000870 [Clostridium acetobutylicum]|uniref:Predicted phosphohydrolase n=1 Tax=Clostridium acetobutylicum (strain ATCC 824 / DSM 792 / JCM 1419 / IAM 19013 / LMG 5710 / NBRC 13948 / NRRL B-527 / VKM B-1787 / 2291 / W) TaxID=272562 RepID=Q97ES9_CLOAB|nr:MULTISPECIES: metallophosphoesterase [Clostridium]AAK80968.1 Predicted phosphohydrolase [Clostridium acetobutylicum ATCC 824]ADZ22070.1 phosphohydrolase [Clostridium acetobutylicum EA 2018]AEI33662.1 phosphohydrolase [Clostridium acetobutylicum DSM 1731]AWV78622.1 metallophosphoesterase [Clostridium acetobutylicum]MBC2393482.1 metallophosphoesterase [Clostridium acetobutylicum]
MKSTLIVIGNIILVILILFIYTMLWYYIGAKGKGIIFGVNLRKKEGLKAVAYWGIFWFLAFSFILSVASRSTISINNKITGILTYLGAISLALFCYLIIIFPITDLIRFILNKLGFSGSLREYMSIIYGRGISIFIAVIIIILFGFWHAIHQTTTNYNISINKKAGKLKQLNVVMVSDVHMGIMIRERGIDKLVTSINKLKPDVVFFCGDMVDESTPTSLEKYYSSAFKEIISKYGVYAITGNHEYATQNSEVAMNYMKKADIKVLEDKAVKVDNSFYVIGRNDAAGGKVKPLNEIMKNADKRLPIIALNHRPVALEEAEKNGVDLQLSGHTHEGQIFPFNFTTKLVFEDDYGYLKKKDFNLIVTSGYGTWGPPIRIGTKGEIVNIKIDFMN